MTNATSIIVLVLIGLAFLLGCVVGYIGAYAAIAAANQQNGNGAG